MARPRPHKRAARLAAISILSVLGAVAVVWAAPRVSGAAEAWMSTPPVRLRTVSLGPALPVVPASGATGGRNAAASDALAPGGPVAALSPDATVAATAATIDAG